MRARILIALLALMIAASACKKKKADGPAPAPTPEPEARVEVLRIPSKVDAVDFRILFSTGSVDDPAGDVVAETGAGQGRKILFSRARPILGRAERAEPAAPGEVHRRREIGITGIFVGRRQAGIGIVFANPLPPKLAAND